MRYGVAVPHANVFATPEAQRTMARAVEDLGFDSLWLSDHIIVPEGSGYIPEMMDEPLATLAFLAAETKHVMPGTSVLIARIGRCSPRSS
jgi:alkanesulfonate monooxygenase SsuD/methylene tetrahydromethanopterin reductase-like flavin-dependent oxidoreductase (luciferase family)